MRRSSDQQSHDAYLSLRCGREDYEDYWTREDSFRNSESTQPATQVVIAQAEPEFDGAATAFPA